MKSIDNNHSIAQRDISDLPVYKLSSQLAIEIWELTDRLPKDELFALIDQVRLTSRSIYFNIAEGWAKRRNHNAYIKHLLASKNSCEETRQWVDFAKDCQYINSNKHNELVEQCAEISVMLQLLISNWEVYH